jgi:protein TonB
MATAITPRDRLSFALFLALSLHAALILGVGFSSSLDFEPSPTIEVTLAQHSDAKAPEEADFIAQSNQLGSGSEEEIHETTTDQQADFFENEFNQVMKDPLPETPQTELVRRELLTTQASALERETTKDELPTEEVLSLTSDNPSLDELAQEIASLEARIATERQAQAKAPRVKRLTSVSTKSADEAAYLNMWRRKVERIGNANFPGGNVYGDLRMLVILLYDGTLKEVRVLKSSGHKALDDAALRIVRLAAPYQYFPVEMRKHYDQLEIIRTWKFSRSGAHLDS